MTSEVIVQPVEMAVSLTAARNAARVNGTALDGDLESFVRAITEKAEHMTGCALITQTHLVALDRFDDAIQMPAYPVQSVASLKYLDVEGAEQTLDPADYYLDKITKPGYIVPAAGKAWPATFGQINAIKVTVVCGYGDTEESIPYGFKGYILAKTQEKFAPAGTPESPFVDRLLDRYKVYG